MRAAVVIWLVFVTAISVAPFEVKWELGAKGRFHDAGHFLVFFVTAMLTCWTAANSASRIVRLLAVCGVALLQEALETAIYHNPFEWRDVLVDTLGAVAAFAILSVLPLLFPGAQRARALRRAEDLAQGD